MAERGLSSHFFAKWYTIASVSIVGAWMRVPHTVQLLLMVMGLDILSGIFASFGSKTMSSSVMVKGLFKKLAVFPLLVLLHLTEKPLNLPFEFESLAALAFIAYESMSIIENCAVAGVPIPTKLVEALAQAKFKTSTPEEIRQQFERGNQSKRSFTHSTEIVRTPGDAPDLEVEKTVTVLEEKKVTPIPASKD